MLFSHRHNKGFLVPDSCRANGKNGYQYKCERDGGHPWKWLWWHLFLLFSEHLAFTFELFDIAG